MSYDCECRWHHGIISKKWPIGRRRGKSGIFQLIMNKVSHTNTYTHARTSDQNLYVPMVLGLDVEMRTPFTEHVFLEEYIESWCPQKGAVHNFMELICIGLSKNPYLSVQQKREHLDWYRNYFEEKRDILQRIIEEKQNTTTQVADGKSTAATTSAAEIPHS